jgi:hypothetical protein
MSNVLMTAAALLLFAGAASGKRLANGTWGGDHIELAVTDGGGEIEYDCAHGTIAGPIALDADGSFAAKGTHAAEHGGPIRKDESPARNAASYSGRVEGDTLTLKVTVGGEDAGTFTLKRGQPGNIFKCR